MKSGVETESKFWDDVDYIEKGKSFSMITAKLSFFT